jgi:hypothetical protein
MVWTAAVACLVWYIQSMPLGTMIAGRALWSMSFALLFAAIGGMGLAGLVWFLPSIIRGEVRDRAPGELLLMTCGVIVIINCTVLAWTAANYPLESLDFYRMYIAVYCVFAVPLFLITGLVCGGPVAWRLALVAPAFPYAVWGLATFLDTKSGGLSYFWYGNRDMTIYLQFLSPIVAAIPIAYAVVSDLLHNQRTAAHWFGIVLFLIAAGQTLHFGGWHRMFGLLIP